MIRFLCHNKIIFLIITSLKTLVKNTVTKNNSLLITINNNNFFVFIIVCHFDNLSCSNHICFFVFLWFCTIHFINKPIYFVSIIVFIIFLLCHRRCWCVLFCQVQYTFHLLLSPSFQTLLMNSRLFLL